MRRPLTLFSKTVFHSTETGYVDLPVFDTPVHLRGYFQSYEYFYGLNERMLPELFDPSESAVRALNVATNPKALAIHVRRGDYFKYAEKFGVLSVDYYQRGILEAINRSSEAFDAISIFSDDPKLVWGELASLKIDLPISLEVPPTSFGSEESLYLMSQSMGVVISNSTFSWWGAFLGEPKSAVVAPKPWFKAKSEPNDLFPQDWSLVDASWQ
jgi:hypothetical protein